MGNRGRSGHDHVEEFIALFYRYDAYGNLQAEVGTVSQPYLFSTKRYDYQLGTYYYGYRFYSPSTGRWLTRDPLGEAGGLNLYGFVGNDPVNLVDQFGLRVLVGQHPAFNNPRNPFNHAAIVLIPDNPGDFANNPIFRNNTATLGGQALGPGFNRFFAWFGALKGEINYPGDCPGNLNDLSEVKTPKGMTDTEFIRALLRAVAAYKDNIIYDPFPIHGPYGVSAYNSNSYVSGVIQAAGGIAPILPGNRPGYDLPLPIHVR